LRTPSFLITLRMAVFHSCLTVASCTTIPARITHDPATNVTSQVSTRSKY
jgi:starvation-inducible outer membrane lipoprotein